MSFSLVESLYFITFLCSSILSPIYDFPHLALGGCPTIEWKNDVCKSMKDPLRQNAFGWKWLQMIRLSVNWFDLRQSKDYLLDGRMIEPTATFVSESEKFGGPQPSSMVSLEVYLKIRIFTRKLLLRGQYLKEFFLLNRQSATRVPWSEHLHLTIWILRFSICLVNDTENLDSGFDDKDFHCQKFCHTNPYALSENILTQNFWEREKKVKFRPKNQPQKLRNKNDERQNWYSPAQIWLF